MSASSAPAPPLHVHRLAAVAAAYWDTASTGRPSPRGLGGLGWGMRREAAGMAEELTQRLRIAFGSDRSLNLRAAGAP